MKRSLLPTMFLVASALSASAASIHTGLLNYWALDNDASDTASAFAESTGVTTDNGTVNGTTSFTPGKFGNAANLPGGAGNNITIADGGVAGGFANDIDRTGSNMTLSVWFKADQWSTGWQAIVSHGEGQDYRLARRATISPTQFAGVVGTTDMLTSTTYGASPNGDGLWHHALLTGTNGGTGRLYIDGVLEATSVGLGDPTVSVGPSGANGGLGNNILCIGCNPDNGREFDGLIDDVALWDRELTAQEVGWIYNGGLAGQSLAAIPEPATSLFGLLGILALIRRRR